MRLASPWLAAALAATLAALPARAADVNRDLDSYALLAGTSLRAKRLRVVSGDVGVSAGSLRVSGSFDAAQSQVVASEAHLGRAACARLFANRARGGGTGCGHAVGFSAPILPNFRAACGAPPSFPRCDRTAKQVFSARRRPGALASPLAPGVYGDLVVAPGEKAVLAGGGAYVFCNLTVGRGARLAVESAADVFVNGKLRATGIDATPDADVRFFVAGRAALAGRVAARHVCVPDGKLTVKNGNLTGHFAAKSLVLVGTVAAMPRPVGTTGTTTSSTITTTTTLPLAQIRFVSTPGTTSCGGQHLSPEATAPVAGDLEDGTSVSLATLGVGCLYSGGGDAGLAGMQLPDAGESYFDVTSVDGSTLALAASGGTGPTSCTTGAHAEKRCMNGAAGTDGNGACGADADCGALPGAAGKCLPDPTCSFGPPLSIPGLACVLNVFDANASGTLDQATGEASLTLPLRSLIYLSIGSGCPVCTSGACTAGPRAGQACTPVGAAGTSLDCPPRDADFFASLVTSLELTTGETSVADSDGLFGCGGAHPGAFGLPGAQVIRLLGTPAGDLGDGAAHPALLVATGCIPATGIALIDGMGSLPGPLAAAIPGTVERRFLVAATTSTSSTTTSSTTSSTAAASTSTTTSSTSSTTTTLPPAFVARIAQAEDGSSGHTSLDAAVSANVPVGSSVIVVASMDAFAGVVTVTDTKGNAYTADLDVSNGTNTTSGLRTMVFSAQLAAGKPLTTSDKITLHHPSTMVHRALVGVQADHLHLPAEKKASAIGTSLVASSSLTPTYANELLIGVTSARIGSGGNVGFAAAPWSAVTNPRLVISGTSHTLVVEYRTTSSVATYARSNSLSASRKWISGIVGYR
jgi:hypothetical protein